MGAGKHHSQSRNGLDHCGCQQKEVKKCNNCLLNNPAGICYCLSKTESFFLYTVRLIFQMFAAYPSGKLITPLTWLHKGTMFWMKSQRKVNIVFKRGKVLTLFFYRKMMNWKENQNQNSMHSRGIFLPILVVLDQAWNTCKWASSAISLKPTNGCTRPWKIHVKEEKYF